MDDDREHCPHCMCRLRDYFIEAAAEVIAEQAFADGELERLLDGDGEQA